MNDKMHKFPLALNNHNKTKKIGTFAIVSLLVSGCKSQQFLSSFDGIESSYFDQISFDSDSSGLEYSFSCSADDTTQTSENDEFEEHANCFDLSQIEYKISVLNELKRKSDDYETFIFYTDHHCFLPNGTYDIDASLLEFELKSVARISDLSESEFVVFGGDLLNNSDTKSQACYKLSTYVKMMDCFFTKYYLLVGNHDFNSQGDTYIASGDYLACMLSQETINDILFDGGQSFYKFKTNSTSYYCFDSGIGYYADYQKKQILWLANDLLKDDNENKVFFIHIALVDGNYALTEMMLEIGKIIEGFNNKIEVQIADCCFDYSSSFGTVSFVQAGHSHQDINSFNCGSVPVIVSTSFGSPEAVSRPTFDIVFIDHTYSLVNCLRIGDGEDRVFSI